MKKKNHYTYFNYQNYLIFMPRTTKKLISKCEQHNFTLRPRHEACYYSQVFAASYCLKQNEKGKSKKNKIQNKKCLDCPIFNKDGNFATPTFILGSQKDYYQERGAKLKEEHQKKMFQYSDEKTDLNVPKPRSKNSFCSVCRQNYEDYLEHIQSLRHKEKINRSLFNSYILEITDKFSHLHKGVEMYNCQGPSQMSTAYDDQVQIIQRNPRKKVKCDQYAMNRQFCIQSPANLYQNGYIPPPPHMAANYNYNPFQFPYQGIGTNPPQNYLSFPHPGQMQYPTHQPQPNQQVSFNYNMNFFMNPYSFPMMPQSSMYNPFLQMPKYFGPSSGMPLPVAYQGSFGSMRPTNHNFGQIPNPSIRASKPPYINVEEQNAII